MSNGPKPNVVLMADDDADDRLLVTDAFAESGMDGELHFVEDGRELLDYLQHLGKYESGANAPRPRLILLDLNMPKKDGREVLREIKSDPDLKRIPVVVLTTSHADTDIGAVYELGANSFVTKPVKYDMLVKVMKALDQYWFGVVELPGPRKAAL